MDEENLQSISDVKPQSQDEATKNLAALFADSDSDDSGSDDELGEDENDYFAERDARRVSNVARTYVSVVHDPEVMPGELKAALLKKVSLEQLETYLYLQLIQAIEEEKQTVWINKVQTHMDNKYLDGSGTDTDTDSMRSTKYGSRRNGSILSKASSSSFDSLH